MRGRSRSSVSPLSLVFYIMSSTKQELIITIHLLTGAVKKGMKITICKLPPLRNTAKQLMKKKKNTVAVSNVLNLFYHFDYKSFNLFSFTMSIISRERMDLIQKGEQCVQHFIEYLALII